MVTLRRTVSTSSRAMSRRASLPRTCTALSWSRARRRRRLRRPTARDARRASAGLPHVAGKLDQFPDHLGGFDGAVLVAAQRRFQDLGERPCLARCSCAAGRQAPASTASAAAPRRGCAVRRSMPRTSERNPSDRIEMSGFSRPAATTMSIMPSDATAREMIWCVRARLGARRRNSHPRRCGVFPGRAVSSDMSGALSTS